MDKRIILMLLTGLILVSCNRQTGDNLQTDHETEEKISDLLSRMTLQEKIGQLNLMTGQWDITGPIPRNDNRDLEEMIRDGKVGAMMNIVGTAAIRSAQEIAVEQSRLGIPLLFGYDVIHGFRTIFPIPLAESCSWEPELAYQTSRVAAIEASASGLNWILGPVVDISREARWGRIMEGVGEDPFLGSRFAFAKITGLQGDDLAANNTVAACAKHFAGYGFVESGLDYNTVEVSNSTMLNVVLPPFKACVDAGVATVMNSFSEIGGIPPTADGYLLQDLLRESWGFEGFVVSDWNSIGELVDHGFAENREEAALLAFTAGSDVDMEGLCYLDHLESLVKEGLVDEALVDDAVRRILRLKFRLGLFDDPYRYCDENREQELILHPDHQELALEAARKSIVLLKNENQILPLRKSGQKIALIGELAADRDSPIGAWRARAETGSAVSVLDGMKNAVSDPSGFRYERGPAYIIGETSFIHKLNINTEKRDGMAEAISLARMSDVVVLVIGEHCFQTGEGRSQADISLKGFQLELLEKIKTVNSRIVVVLMNGRPLDLTEVVEHAEAIVEAWHLGTQSGNAIADVLFGDYNPSGKLTVSFPRSSGQLPVYYNHKHGGRPDDNGDNIFYSHYTDISKEPLFPFGYGLSYTDFVYSDLEISDSVLTKDNGLTATVTIENNGEYSGEEIVQLYIRDHTGSITRPVRELKGFEKIMLEPAEKREVHFTIGIEELKFFGRDQNPVAEPGMFTLWIGPNSDEGLTATFVLE